VTDPRIDALADRLYGFGLGPLDARRNVAERFLATVDAVDPARVALTAALDKARYEALHAVATEIKAFLEKEFSPPIWWRTYDIPHRLAGCVWDDNGGQDGFGQYDCEES
jgi:hypothetical protein